MRISDWSSDVCSSDLKGAGALAVEIALQPVADRFVEQYAGPAGAEQHGELARRGVDGAQIDERLGQRFVDRAVHLFGLEQRSEERGGGKECGRTGRSRWWPYH